MRSAILIFTRLPGREGAAKPLGRTGGPSAMTVATTLLQRTLDAAGAAGVDVVVAYDGSPRLAPGDCRHALPQRGTTFGRRLRNAVSDTFALGYRRVVVVGSDTPALSGALCRQALAALAAGDDRTVVIGPSRDGGYYLIGFNCFDERAFAHIPWMTRRVLARTRRALAGAPLVLLPTLRDADDVGSLRGALGEAPPVAALVVLRRLLRVRHERAAVLPPKPPAAFDLALLPVRRGPPFSILPC